MDYIRGHGAGQVVLWTGERKITPRIIFVFRGGGVDVKYGRGEFLREEMGIASGTGILGFLTFFQWSPSTLKSKKLLGVKLLALP